MRGVMAGLGIALILLAAGQGGRMLAAGQTAAPAAGPSRAELKAEERLCDKAIGTYGIDSIDQLTHARALYIEGYGVLISFDVNLAKMSPLMGLMGGLSKEQQDRLHENKVKRLPEFRHFLEELVVEAVQPLEHLSPQERLLVHVDFEYAPYENRNGLPDSISIDAKKKDLLDAAARKMPPEGLAGILKVRIE